MRVVLDTNILISACWKPGGLEAQIADMALAGTLTPCISAQVWHEYREVLARDKFAALREATLQLLEGLESRACRVEPEQPVHAAMDEDDNRFLECAAAAGAAYLITGNLRHYPPEWGVTKVVNARQFLAARSTDVIELT